MKICNRYTDAVLPSRAWVKKLASKFYKIEGILDDVYDGDVGALLGIPWALLGHESDKPQINVMTTQQKLNGWIDRRMDGWERMG